MTAVIVTTALPPAPSPQNQQANHASHRGCSAPIRLSPATCWFSDVVYLGLTSAKWCSRTSLADLRTDLTGGATQEGWIFRAALSPLPAVLLAPWSLSARCPTHGPVRGGRRNFGGSGSDTGEGPCRCHTQWRFRVRLFKGCLNGHFLLEKDERSYFCPRAVRFTFPGDWAAWKRVPFLCTEQSLRAAISINWRLASGRTACVLLL